MADIARSDVEASKTITKTAGVEESSLTGYRAGVATPKESRDVFGARRKCRQKTSGRRVSAATSTVMFTSLHHTLQLIIQLRMHATTGRYSYIWLCSGSYPCVAAYNIVTEQNHNSLILFKAYSVTSLPRRSLSWAVVTSLAGGAMVLLSRRL